MDMRHIITTKCLKQNLGSYLNKLLTLMWTWNQRETGLSKQTPLLYQFSPLCIATLELVYLHIELNHIVIVT